jgi:hypothetical protein
MYGKGLAVAVLTLTLAAPSFAQGPSSLRQFCAEQNRLCTEPGCTGNPGPKGLEYCRNVVCGGRLDTCLKTGCYPWRTRPATCFQSK